MARKREHQFSLGRLPLAVATIASVLAPAILFPVATAELVTVNLLLIAPAGVVSGIAFWLSNNRQRTTVMLIVGLLLGWLLAPTLFVSWSRPPTFWEEFKIDFETTGLFMFGGAIVAAILDLER